MRFELTVDNISDVEEIVGILVQNGYRVSVRKVPHKTGGFVIDHYEVEVEELIGETE